MTRKVKRPTRTSVEDCAAEDANKAYECADCRSAFSTESSLTIHCKIHNGKPYPCRECKNYFTHNKILQKHMLSHDRKKMHSCPQCDKQFSQLQNLKMHLNIHTGAKPFKCKEADCTAAFAYVGSLKNHMASVHGSGDQKVSAKPDSGKLKSVSVRNQDTKKRHRCYMCKKTYLSELSLRFHLTHHVGSKPYKCPMAWCPAVFADVKTLQDHKRSTHSGKPCNAKPFTVKLSSGKRFMEKGCLQRMKRKNGASYSCPECGKEFNQGSNLQLHMNRHLGLKPYKCKFEWCNAAFADAGTNRRHRLTVHSGNILFKCKLCDAGFKRKICLEEHVDEFHKTSKRKSTGKAKAVPLLKNGKIGQRPVKCEQCNAEFFHKGFMLKHVRLTHTNELKKTEVPKTARKQTGDIEQTVSDVGNGKVTFKCDQCSAQFKLRRLLELHIRRIHQIHAPKETLSSPSKRIHASDASDTNSSHTTPKRVPASDASDTNSSHTTTKLIPARDASNTNSSHSTPKRVPASDASDTNSSHTTPKRIHARDASNTNSSHSTPKRIHARDASDTNSSHTTPKRVPASDKSDEAPTQTTPMHSPASDKPLLQVTTLLQVPIPNCDVNSVVKKKRGRKPAFTCVKCDQCGAQFKLRRLLELHIRRIHQIHAPKETLSSPSKRIHASDASDINSSHTTPKHVPASDKSDEAPTQPTPMHIPASDKPDVTLLQGPIPNCDANSVVKKKRGRKPAITCVHCGRKFKYRNHLQQHARSCLKGKTRTGRKPMPSIKCKFCNAEYKYKAALRKHESQSHYDDSLSCKSEVISVTEAPAVECEDQSKAPPISKKKAHLKCKMCSAEFKHQINLLSHVRCSHASAKYHKLNLPKYVRKERLNNLQKAVSGILSDKNVAFKCEQCSSEFKYHVDLLKHVRSIHSSAMVVRLPDKTDMVKSVLQRQQVEKISYKCELCDDKFRRRRKLIKHIRIAHGGRKQFRCPSCDTAFKRKSHLQKHVCDGDSGETFVYKCEHCTAEFKECNELVEHVRQHGSDILDMCDETNETLQEDLVQNPFEAEGNVSPDLESDLTNDANSQHECGKCGDLFMDRKSLHHHLLVHAAERG